jgi:hypothetical protein
LRPATVEPFCATHKLDGRLLLLAGRGLLPGHGQDQADLERRARLGVGGAGKRGGGEQRERETKGEAALHAGSFESIARFSRRLRRRQCGHSPTAGERLPIMAPSLPRPREATMTTRTQPPFRADHVGSFLRPKRLLDARERRAKGEITAEQLRAVEDDAITEIVRFQEDVGLKSVTDGEFRRTYFHIDFLEQLGGVKTDIPVTIKKPDGSEELAPPVMRVIDKVRHVKDIQRADFEYLKSQVSAGHTPKVSIPSPTMLHFRGGRAGISREHYPDLEPFWQDVADAYGAELRSLADAGLQLRTDGRHQPRVPVRRQDARGSALARRRSRTSCRTATRRSSTASSPRSRRE